MIELRWLMKEGDADNWPEKVLQYRQPEWIGNDKFMGEWVDVPTEGTQSNVEISGDKNGAS